MNGKKKALAFVLTLALSLTSITGIAFAEINYNQWNSQSAYPPDVINTQWFASVKFLMDKKIITGYPDGTFKPNNLISRAEIAVAVTKMTNNTSNLEAMANKNKFNDLAGYEWAKGYINALVNVNIVKGMTDTTFAPGKNISYAELVTMLIRTRSSAASELEAMGDWPNNYIQYAQMYGIIGDVVITDWNAPATRGDVAKLMYRIMPKSTSSSSN